MEEITISMEEYKELLQIKGRYEELKEYIEYQNNIPTTIYRQLTRDTDLCNMKPTYDIKPEISD
jgi:hypothetical protein